MSEYEIVYDEDGNDITADYYSGKYAMPINKKQMLWNTPVGFFLIVAGIALVAVVWIITHQKTELQKNIDSNCDRWSDGSNPAYTNQWC